MHGSASFLSDSRAVNDLIQIELELNLRMHILSERKKNEKSTYLGLLNHVCCLSRWDRGQDLELAPSFVFLLLNSNIIIA